MAYTTDQIKTDDHVELEPDEARAAERKGYVTRILFVSAALTIGAAIILGVY